MLPEEIKAGQDTRYPAKFVRAEARAQDGVNRDYGAKASRCLRDQAFLYVSDR